jgi:hypothetical protein
MMAEINLNDQYKITHSVHIMSSIIKQQSSFQFNLENQEQDSQHLLGS